MDRKFLAKVRRKDRIARWVITTVGIGVIGVVILIIASIAAVAFPLFTNGSTRVLRDASAPDNAAALNFGGGSDEYLETAYLIDGDGAFRFFETKTGAILDTNTVNGAEGALLAANLSGQDRYDMVWEDGTARAIEVWFRPEFDDDLNRTITHRLYQNIEASAPEDFDKANTLRTHLSKDEDETYRVDVRADGSVTWFYYDEGDLEREFELLPAGDYAPLIAMQRDGDLLYLSKGTVLEQWDYRRRKPVVKDSVTNSSPITAMTFGNSEISVFVGSENGELVTYMPIPTVKKDDDGTVRTFPRLGKVHDLASHSSPIKQLISATPNKSILSLSEEGAIHYDYMTNERSLRQADDFAMEGWDASGARLSLAARADSIFAAAPDGRVAIWEFDLPHPEASMNSLFGKVHYENARGPKFEWQSSSGDDAYEEKYSLIPLVMGTLKATIYAMFFAAPIAILAALYSSQFMAPSLRNKIKPMVEIMAAVPSVVVGFLAAFWLAPILVKYMPAFFVSVLVIPLTIWGAVRLWRTYGVRTSSGRELFLLIPVLILGVLLSVLAGGAVERMFMATESYPNGNFARWLSNEHGLRLDPRNGILISFALGFAVIPIIFTLSDDAMSRVPKNLNAASLALGASRWQTAWKVVLPSASPGIFAALMIGFGRAIGETMIVLMAAGNTPLMNLNPFNGMRTLSANIATEVGEAPVGSTHYRVLFLSAVLLFVLTFLVNTVAELVRMRLRKKFANY